MKKTFTEEEFEWIKQNKEEFIKEIVPPLVKVSYEFELRKEELLSIEPKEERMKKVKEIIQSILYGDSNDDWD